MTTTTPIRWKDLSAADRDCLVCEHVLGYRPTNNPDGMTDEQVIQFWNHTRGGCIISDPWQSKHQPEPYKHKWQHQWRNFRPTSDLSAAFQVVEKMREKHWWSMSDNDGDVWVVYCTQKHEEPDTNSAASRSLPEAICLAALKASGVTIERE